MRSSWKRLTIAFLLSFFCALATFVWYQKTTPLYDDNHKTPLAQIERIGNEVLKRPPTRLLWQSLSRGDNVFSGETIHTSSQGEVRIQFEDGRYIDVEPDSLIVLKKNEGEIAMDLLEGSLFVNAQEATTANTELVLNSKSGKLDLNGSSASLTKSGTDQLDVQITAGQAKIKDKSGKTQEMNSGKLSTLNPKGFEIDQPRLQSLLPKASTKIFIEPSQKAAIPLTWTGLGDHQTVEVLFGETRNNLKELTQVSELKAGGVTAHLSPGKYWWKLVARDVTTHQKISETPSKRIEILPGFAPTSVNPTDGAQIKNAAAITDVNFRWQKPLLAEKTQIEVFKKEDLNTPIYKKILTDEESIILPQLKQGDYAWRLNSLYEDTEHIFIGSFKFFSIGYPELAEILWNFSDQKTAQFFANQPEVNLAWKIKNRESEVAQYKLKVEDQTKTYALTLDAKDQSAKIMVQKAGSYNASVEAFDKNGNLVGHSKTQTISLNEIPLLPHPVLREPMGNHWRSNKSGALEARWDSLPQAKKYFLIIENSQKKEVSRLSISLPSASIKGILPGQYKVKILGVDEYGREGQPSMVTLEVPDKSNLKPPTLKRVSVE